MLCRGQSHQPQLGAFVLVVVAQQPPHRRGRVARPRDDVEQHRAADPHPGHQRFRLGGDDALEHLLGPRHLALGCLLPLHPLELLRVVTGLLDQPVVLDDVLGCLYDDSARRVEPGPARPAGDLVELACLEHPLPAAVVLRQAGEHHRPDRHVDADAEGVRAADDLEQAGLRELLDQASVLRQHPGVVHAHAVLHQSRQGLAEAGAEPEAADQLGDPVLLLAGADVDARQRLGPFQCRDLGEVHDVHRSLVGGEQLLDRLVHRCHRPLIAQRDRTGDARDDRGLPLRTTTQVVDEPGHVAERRGHQQELRLRQLEQRHLPGPAAVGLGIEVELVHHHLADVGLGTLAQRDVGQHLGGAADDRRLGVDRGVTGQHPDVVGAEDVDQGEELLRDQGLDRRGVEGPLSPRQSGEMGASGDQALPGAGRRGEDDVGPGDDLDQRFFLRRVEGQALLGHPRLERVEQRVRVGAARRATGCVIRCVGDSVEEWHRPAIVPDGRVDRPISGLCGRASSLHGRSLRPGYDGPRSCLSGRHPCRVPCRRPSYDVHRLRRLRVDRRR